MWVFLLATPAAAQIAAPAPPGPYVVDLRGATSAIPVDAGFYPPVPVGTSVPSRGFGVDVGAHVYLFHVGPARLGVGASLLRVRGAVSPVPRPSGSTSSSLTGAATTPEVDAAVTAVAPQLSFNFGSAAGWSYLSAGVGRARVTSVTSAFAGTAAESGVTGAENANSGMLSSLNFGGGARWFPKTRLGVSFDLRVHRISRGTADPSRPATPRTTVVAASVGISVR
jgi:hypothetical protein